MIRLNDPAVIRAWQGIVNDRLRRLARPADEMGLMVLLRPTEADGSAFSVKVAVMPRDALIASLQGGWAAAMELRKYSFATALDAAIVKIRHTVRGSVPVVVESDEGFPVVVSVDIPRTVRGQA